MARKFPTAEEALEYIDSLSDEEYDDPEMIIIPPEPDALKQRGTSDALFNKANKMAAVRWNDNRVVSLLSNFEVTTTKVHSKVQRRVEGGRMDVDVPLCVTSYNKYKNGVDLFDCHMENYFTSIQGKKW
ncbi:hypothetical protein AVEN_202144-1 [Araneus ventricosus]|uniref:PiggyBac transposable element-derived protein domain-containing protein n=1 Tax=Araneus ventricosus TaxID=182803 RepID=A0A4Y2E3K7_ARAVE|nr:hypothetical protein AVEN_202144-1 [Araneus ventricosus]